MPLVRLFRRRVGPYRGRRGLRDRRRATASCRRVSRTNRRRRGETRHRWTPRGHAVRRPRPAGRRPGLGDKRARSTVSPAPSPGVLLDAFSRATPVCRSATTPRPSGRSVTSERGLTIFRRHSWRCEEKGPRHEPVWGGVRTRGAHERARGARETQATAAGSRVGRRGRAGCGVRPWVATPSPPAHAPRDGSNSLPRDSVFGTLFSPDEPSPNEWTGAGAGGGWGGRGRRTTRTTRAGPGADGARTSATTTAAEAAGARTSPSTSTTPARAGMGRRLGRRCPRGHRRLGLRPRGRTAGRVRMGRVRPARRSRREPHRVRRGPERSLGQGKSHPPNRRRATRSLIVSARVGARSAQKPNEPSSKSQHAPAPAPARRAHAWKTDRGVGAPAARRRSADEEAATAPARDARGTRASPRRRRNSPPELTVPNLTVPNLTVLSPSPSPTRADASAERRPKRRLAAIESIRRRDADAGTTRLAPRERSRASSAVTNAAAAAAAVSPRRSHSKDPSRRRGTSTRRRLIRTSSRLPSRDGGGNQETENEGGGRGGETRGGETRSGQTRAASANAKANASSKPAARTTRRPSVRGVAAADERDEDLRESGG